MKEDYNKRHVTNKNICGRVRGSEGGTVGASVQRTLGLAELIAVMDWSYSPELLLLQ